MRRLLLLLAILMLLGVNPAQAQRSQDFGEYVVHFNAINSNLIPPDVAAAYDIQRSSSRGLLNITVLRKAMGNPNAPVHSTVKASAINLTGQRREIEMREIDENGAIYYLGEFRVSNMETFDFTVQVTPDGRSEPYEVKFRQQFYTE
ncbi:MAG: hypothetical protein Tsb002_17310 [Wenzhouxiangellaceae bacterium]